MTLVRWAKRLVRWAKRHFDLLKAIVPAAVALILLSIVGLEVRDAQTATNRQLRGEVKALVKRLSDDEFKTCKIQSRGLPASHDLAAAMADIHSLLIQKPHTPAQRAAAQQTPPNVKRIVRDLNRNLAAYLALESKQPPGRTCS